MKSMICSRFLRDCGMWSRMQSRGSPRRLWMEETHSKWDSSHAWGRDGSTLPQKAFCHSLDLVVESKLDVPTSSDKIPYIESRSMQNE